MRTDSTNSPPVNGKVVVTGPAPKAAPAAPAAPATPAVPAAAVIRRLEAAEETSQERLVKKHVPAWVLSGAIHVVVIALAILILGVRKADTKQSDKIIATTAEKTNQLEEKDLKNDELGFDTNLPAEIPEIKREADMTAKGIESADAVGQPDAPAIDKASLPNPGLDNTNLLDPGVIGAQGNLLSGKGGEMGNVLSTYPGRSGATKNALLKAGGGNDASERAVGMGLAWLVRQQMKDGGWAFEQGTHTKERACATGLALLPFLAAGETHQLNKDRPKNTTDYHKNVKAGLDFLKSICPLGGPNAGRMSENMYSQAIATIPLCEAYGMTKDPALKPFAQAAITYIQRAQGRNGSWGYTFGDEGDTSIVGWQVQALQAAKLSKGLIVDDRIIQKAIKFLDSAAGGSKRSMYGYSNSANAAPGTALTAVGLLSRYYIDKWGPNHPGMTDGVGGLMKKPPIGKGPLKDMYYYYYATQVVHFFEGPEWKDWNEGKEVGGVRKGGMRDWLVESQLRDPKNMTTHGSWDLEDGWFGRGCGRLGTTAICLLTLEVYYRHLPLYKRADNSGAAIKIIE